MADGDWWSNVELRPELHEIFGRFEELLQDDIFVPFELSQDRSDGELSYAEIRAFLLERNRVRWSDIYDTSFTVRRDIDLTSLWEIYRYLIQLVGGEYPLEIEETTRNEILYDLELMSNLCIAISRRALILRDRVSRTSDRPRRLRPQTVSVRAEQEYLEEAERVYSDLERLFEEPVQATELSQEQNSETGVEQI